MELHLKELHSDILIKLSKDKKSTRKLSGELSIQRKTFITMSESESIGMNAFLKLINWLKMPPEKYIK